MTLQYPALSYRRTPVLLEHMMRRLTPSCLGGWGALSVTPSSLLHLQPSTLRPHLAGAHDEASDALLLGRVGRPVGGPLIPAAPSTLNPETPPCRST